METGFSNVSMNRDSFISSFPIWMPFISSSCLTALVSTSNTVFSRRGDIRQASLIPDLKGKHEVCHH